MAAPFHCEASCRPSFEKAVKEINMYTDIEASWEPVCKGRKVVKLLFIIKNEMQQKGLSLEKGQQNQ